MKYELTLFVARDSKHGDLALENLRRFCETNLTHFEIQVVDVFQHPAYAEEADIVEIPTVIRESPLPRRRIVGDLTDHEKLLVSLKSRAPRDEPSV